MTQQPGEKKQISDQPLGPPPRTLGWWAATFVWAVVIAAILGVIFALGPYVLTLFGKESSKRARNDLMQLLSNHDSYWWVKIRFVIGTIIGAILCFWYRNENR